MPQDRLKKAATHMYAFDVKDAATFNKEYAAWAQKAGDIEIVASHQAGDGSNVLLLHYRHKSERTVQASVGEVGVRPPRRRSRKPKP